MYIVLPKLIRTIVFIGLFIKGQLFQNCFNIILRQILDKFSVRIGFKVGNILVWLLALQYKMAMIFQYRIGADLHTLVDKKTLGLQKNSKGSRSYEYWYPMKYDNDNKLQRFRIGDFIVVSAHGLCSVCFPTAERGSEEHEDNNITFISFI